MDAASLAYLSLLKRDNPIAVYPMQEMQNTKLYDFSGRHIDAGLNNIGMSTRGPGIGAFSPWAVDKRLGDEGYYDATNNSLFDFGDVFTLETWHKRRSGGVNNASLIAKGVDGYLLRFDETNGVYRLLRSHVANMAHTSETYITPLWRHIMATKNGATMKMYVNGKDVTSIDTNSTCINTSVPLLIGVDYNPGIFALEDYLTGSMAWTAVYSTVLSHAAAASRYYAGRSFIANGQGRSRLRVA